ncbi:MAG: acyloxyacyl hydrolase [Steroidobacteraceae bacterium]
MRSWCVQLALLLAALAARAADAGGASFCADCQVQAGVGATYHYWGSTGSAVIPVTLVWGEDRWELGAFRMASGQNFYDSRFGAEVHLADPYWGFSASRRWEFVRRPHWRLLIGLGGSYKTEVDRLSASHWNFAEQLGLRIIPVPGTAVELSLRHWSNAGLKLPNHGQDFATLTFVVTPAKFGH